MYNFQEMGEGSAIGNAESRKRQGGGGKQKNLKHIRQTEST